MSILQQTRLHTLDNFAEAEQVWGTLVRPQTLYDEWSFRQCFFDQHNQELSFQVDDPDQPRVLIPLQRHRENGRLTFMSAPFMERNRGFCDGSFDNLLIAGYRSLQGDVSLDDICEEDPLTRTGDCAPSDPAYQLRKDEVGGILPEDLIRFVPKNIRENIRRNRKRVDRGEIMAEEAELTQAIQAIRTLSYARFGDDAWLELDAMRTGFARLPELEIELDTSLQCILLRSQKQILAGCISVRYRNDFYMLMAAAVHHHDYSGIGSYLYYVSMTRAFADGCDRIDTGIGDGGWKERWGLEKVPQFKFTSDNALTT